MVSVGRKLLGAGRLDSPSCRTDLDDAGDPQWYAGVVRNNLKLVDADMIAVLAGPKADLRRSGKRG